MFYSDIIDTKNTLDLEKPKSIKMTENSHVYDFSDFKKPYPINTSKILAYSKKI